MRYFGDVKNCNTLLIEAFFRTVERAYTPEDLASQNKARPSSVRATPLFDSGDAPTTDEHTDLFIPDSAGPKSTIQKPRDSTIQRQLVAKAKSDASAPALEKLRSQIFAIHLCKEEGICSNAGACCFELSRNRSHHKVSYLEQKEWAEAITVGVKNVSLERPPADWIAKYQEGWNRTTMKRGKRTSDPIEQVPAQPTQPSQTVQNQAPVIHYNMAPTAPARSRYSPEYRHSHPYSRRPQHHRPRYQPYERQRAPTLSSPIRGVDNREALQKYKEFLLYDEADPPRRQAIESAIDVAQAQWLDDLEILKLPATVDTLEKHKVPSGIAMLIVKKVSEFKRVYNGQAELRAAEGLIGMGNPRGNQQPNQPSFQPASHRQTGGYYGEIEEPEWDDEIDYFDEY